MKINVLFFGVIAEVTGTHIKTYNGVRSYGDLRYRIQDDFPEMIHYNFRIAVNNQIVDEDPVLKTGDEVAYLPPFAGG